MSKWYELSLKIETSVRQEFKKRKGKEIYPNVDFYSPSVYYLMGIDPDLFTSIFAVSRISGWCAHIIEEKFAEAQQNLLSIDRKLIILEIIAGLKNANMCP